MAPTAPSAGRILAARAARGVVTAALAILCSACASISTAPPDGARQALAPTGKLRVAFLVAPLYATKDPASGELKGVAVDLGKALAQQVDVPFETVVYASFPDLMAGAKSGQWDDAMMGVDASRATVVDFSAPYMNVEQGFLVRAGASIAEASAVDVARLYRGHVQPGGYTPGLQGSGPPDGHAGHFDQ